MPVSKRTRFEVLRRDGHRCRYCGAVASESELTVDHVLPVALGGGDGPDNLVAACRDCNAGKASSSPNEALVAQVGDDAVRWAAARHLASERLAAEVECRTAYRDGFLDAWNEWGQFAHKWLPSDWPVSVTRWQEQGLPLVALTEAVDIAMAAKLPGPRIFIYMCGVVKRRMAELDAATMAQVKPADPESPVDDYDMAAEYDRGVIDGRLDALWDITQIVDHGHEKLVAGVRKFGPKNFPTVWVA